MNQSTSLEQTRLLNNQKYREWYRKEVLPKWYSPVLHVGLNIGLLVLAVIINFSLVREWNWVSFAVMVFIFFFGNAAVFFLHKYPLHRRFKYWAFPYDTHTVLHHRFFTAETITYDSARDFNAVFFPMSVIGSFVLLGTPAIYFGARYLWGSDVAHVLSGSAAGYFITYEFFHWASHLPKNHFFMKVPWIAYMREHHIAHHNPRLMNKYNFCIVDPTFDFIFGTKYREKLPVDSIEDHYQNVKTNLGV